MSTEDQARRIKFGELGLPATLEVFASIRAFLANTGLAADKRFLLVAMLEELSRYQSFKRLEVPSEPTFNEMIETLCSIGEAGRKSEKFRRVIGAKDKIEKRAVGADGEPEEWEPIRGEDIRSEYLKQKTRPLRNYSIRAILHARPLYDPFEERKRKAMEQNEGAEKYEAAAKIVEGLASTVDSALHTDFAPQEGDGRVVYTRIVQSLLPLAGNSPEEKSAKLMCFAWAQKLSPNDVGRLYELLKMAEVEEESSEHVILSLVMAIVRISIPPPSLIASISNPSLRPIDIGSFWGGIGLYDERLCAHVEGILKVALKAELKERSAQASPRPRSEEKEQVKIGEFPPPPIRLASNQRWTFISDWQSENHHSTDFD